jgi:peptide deformylase
MAILQVLYHPDPRLRIKAAPVAVIDDEVRRLATDMMETMYAAPGIGLAATQVNVHRRLLVTDVSETHDQPLCLINPTLLQKEGVECMEEGCLSVPGVFEEVERASRTSKAIPWSKTPTACSPCASSTRWTISRASCFWITSRP